MDMPAQENGRTSRRKPTSSPSRQGEMLAARLDVSLLLSVSNDSAFDPLAVPADVRVGKQDVVPSGMRARVGGTVGVGTPEATHTSCPPHDTRIFYLPSKGRVKQKGEGCSGAEKAEKICC
jgi:hypothetical protein